MAGSFTSWYKKKESELQKEAERTHLRNGLSRNDIERSERTNEFSKESAIDYRSKQRLIDGKKLGLTR